ncbi:Cys-tRNA(Pro) deacylase [Actinobacteria bacterium YIM 96077]|uniref:Cys-tRNA(Pro)/Cys-tRNA(Cys) deacylase n=1 Tax=Phytoactinopolyspora halophila TaxID=1981511 RepID=A0A329QVJ2_9ACTN|nr:Cys-tRNA(Pro) deacylase [Phytoactinopolyspora halophila]AYY12860.1 Cys-tRNA(Pro) deacylase [Actinobacteria bacterium YIM 96077]RAW16347.1 Cys-tRNA(Pro) deacylase [Phytoactinopolyspora halophila]
MSKRRRANSGTPATVMLDRAGVSYTLHPYQHDPSADSFGLEAAAALGVDAERVFKTLLADVDGRLVVGIVPVTDSLDLKALARAAGGKRATMAEVATAERATGYVAGGISPLGQRKQLPTILDESAREFPTIYVSGGRRGLDIELSPDDLRTLTGATIAAISRSDAPA